MADSLRPVGTKTIFGLSALAGVPAVAPASAGRRLEARGVEPLFPACYVQQRPRMLYQSHFGGGYALMYRRGRTRMLLVLLLPWQASGNLRDRGIGPLVPESGNGRQRRISMIETNIRRRSRVLKCSNQRFFHKRFCQWRGSRL
jgi:hypothetical protein